MLSTQAVSDLNQGFGHRFQLGDRENQSTPRAASFRQRPSLASSMVYQPCFILSPLPVAHCTVGTLAFCLLLTTPSSSRLRAFAPPYPVAGVLFPWLFSHWFIQVLLHLMAVSDTFPDSFVGCLLPCNKSPQNTAAENNRKLSAGVVSEGQQLPSSLAGWFWLRFPKCGVRVAAGLQLSQSVTTCGPTSTGPSLAVAICTTWNCP